MSVRWVQAVFERSRSRSGGRLVMLALADRANDDGVCWPGVADIARRANLSMDQTRRCLRNAEKLGELRIKKGGGCDANGKGYPSVYQLVLPVTPACTPGLPGKPTPASVHRTPASVTGNPSKSNGQALQNERATPAPVQGEPSGTVREPSFNHHQNHQGPEARDFQSDRLTEEDLRLAQVHANARKRTAYSASRGPRKLDARASLPRRPADEQRQVFELLQTVDGLDRADAVDLARIAPLAVFQAVIPKMGKHVKNPGGWLRTAVRKAMNHTDSGNGLKAVDTMADVLHNVKGRTP